MLTRGLLMIMISTPAVLRFVFGLEKKTNDLESFQ